MRLFDSFFSLILNIRYVQARISQSISESSLDFEIPSVDYSLKAEIIESNSHAHKSKQKLQCQVILVRLVSFGLISDTHKFDKISEWAE